MQNIAANPSAFADFLQIIHCYGAFIKERDVVRSFSPSTSYAPLLRKYQFSESYSEMWNAYLENTDAIGCLNDAISGFRQLHENMSAHLVSTEKHLRKLKHLFATNYPSLASEMSNGLKAHQAHVENKKRQKHQAYDAIIGMTSRLASFGFHSFACGDRDPIVYRSYFYFIVDKHNLTFDRLKLQELEMKLEESRRGRNQSLNLTFDEIMFISEILRAFITHTSPCDLQSISQIMASSKEENIPVATQILTKNTERFTKLLHDFDARLKTFLAL